jgi:hypothetical protein
MTGQIIIAARHWICGDLIINRMMCFKGINMQHRLKLALLIFFLFASPAHADISNGLVGWWKLDDNGGVTASDSSNIFGQTQNDGTLSGATLPSWVAGKMSYGLTFDGSSSFVSIGSAASLNFTGSGTLSGWIKTTSAGTGVIFIKTSDGGGVGRWGMQIRINLSKAEAYVVTTSAGVTAFNVTSTNNIDDGNWHHVVEVWDNATGIITLYIDGVSKTTSTGTNTLRSGLGTSYIGKQTNSANTSQNFFNGSIDDVRIYNRALSAGEVRDIYESNSFNIGGE